ncbi:MAG: class I SAM-dependent methyltransferase [Pseudomonadota bacterium]|nr:class I SAM-dependent methyltransferase [Pseudomonadota bacterium]
MTAKTEKSTLITATAAAAGGDSKNAGISEISDTTKNGAARAKWRVEYETAGLPSSRRTTPSGAVVWWVETLRHEQMPLRSAIDLGCGKGRNRLFLAGEGLEVTAMDFTPDAIQQLSPSAAARGLKQKIRALVSDVTEDWPLPPATADLVVDAFCFKHIAPYEARLTYKGNLLRSLRSRGHFLISFASIGDGYYGQYFLDTQIVNGEPQHLVADPVAGPENGIQSTLYTRNHGLDFFAPALTLFNELHAAKPAMMHGKVYDRDTYALLLHRNPHRLFG